MRNPYLPNIAVIKDIKQETLGARPIKTFTTVFKDEDAKNTFKQDPGQCAMVGIAGVGESMISVC